MPPQPISITAPHLLLVEGEDAREICKRLVDVVPIANSQIVNYGGKTELRTFLDALVLTPGFYRVTTLSVISDADRAPRSSFQSIRDSLANVGLVPPKTFGSVGKGKPRVGTFLFPNNKDSGILEDMCLAAATFDPVIKCVDQFIACAEKAHGHRHASPSKARLSAYLATKKTGTLRCGQAIDANVFQRNAAEFQPLVQYLGQVHY